MGETENPSLTWFGNFWTCPWAPKQILFIFGGTKILQIIQENPQTVLDKCDCWEYQQFGDRAFWQFGKRQVPINHEDPSYEFLKLLSMRSISFKKHAIAMFEILNRAQYLPKDIKRKCGIMGPYIRKHKQMWNPIFESTEILTEQICSMIFLYILVMQSFEVIVV